MGLDMYLKRTERRDLASEFEVYTHFATRYINQAAKNAIEKNDIASLVVFDLCRSERNRMFLKPGQDVLSMIRQDFLDQLENVADPDRVQIEEAAHAHNMTATDPAPLSLEATRYLKRLGHPYQLPEYGAVTPEGLIEWDDTFEVLYWRKENHIHAWFVDHVQDGIDECQVVEVTRDHLQLLRDTLDEAKQVFESRLSDDEKQERLSELLPTRGGFFFGPTDYDEYYKQGIDYTLEGIDALLVDFDFDREMLLYTSSW